MKIATKLVFGVLLSGSLAGCFRPIVYLQNQPNYPVDIFYANERPDRPFIPLRELEIKNETPVVAQQMVDRRMVKRGNNMQEKELLLARMSLQAKNLGADALVDVQYSYFTSMTTNGYILKGIAAKYQVEYEQQ